MKTLDLASRLDVGISDIWADDVQRYAEIGGLLLAGEMDKPGILVPLAELAARTEHVFEEKTEKL